MVSSRTKVWGVCINITIVCCYVLYSMVDSLKTIVNSPLEALGVGVETGLTHVTEAYSVI